MRILITGHHGQLAQALQRELASDGLVMALGRDQLDLTDLPCLRQRVRQLQPDLIINAAAYTAVDRAESEPRQAFALNAEAPGVLAEEAARLGIGLIHYSSDYVFDGQKAEPYREDDEPNPLSVYGCSKLAGEQAVQAAGDQYLILRTSWIYSLHGRNFLLTMQRLLQSPRLVNVVADEFGAPTWAGTVAAVTAQMVRQWRHGCRRLDGLYHLTASGSTSWYGFASLIAQHLAGQGRLAATLKPIDAIDYPTAARRPHNSRLDCSRLQANWDLQLPHWEQAARLCLQEQDSLERLLAMPAQHS